MADIHKPKLSFTSPIPLSDSPTSGGLDTHSIVPFGSPDLPFLRSDTIGGLVNQTRSLTNTTCGGTSRRVGKAPEPETHGKIDRRARLTSWISRG
jgi:hypothetical protein